MKSSINMARQVRYTDAEGIIFFDMSKIMEVRDVINGIVKERKDTKPTDNGFGADVMSHVPTYKAGTYIIEWDGPIDGVSMRSARGFEYRRGVSKPNELSIYNCPKSKNTFSINISKMVSRISILHVDDIGKGEFRPELIRYFEKFNTIRVMPAININEFYRTDLRWTWSNRYLSYYHNPWGVPIDVLCRFCVETKCALYLCIHDTIMTHDPNWDGTLSIMCDVIKEHLPRGWELYIEYSNEIFNFAPGYPQRDRVREFAINNRHLNEWRGDPDKQQYKQYGIFSAKVFDRFRYEGMGEHYKLNTVVGGQASNHWTLRQALNAPFKGSTVATHTTHAAGGFYIGHNPPEGLNGNQLVSYLRDRMDYRLGTNENPGSHRKFFRTAHEFDCKVIGYEAGEHLYRKKDDKDLYPDLSRNNRISKVVLEYYDVLDELGCVDNCHFLSPGNGHWPLYEDTFLYQELTKNATTEPIEDPEPNPVPDPDPIDDEPIDVSDPDPVDENLEQRVLDLEASLAAVTGINDAQNTRLDIHGNKITDQLNELNNLTRQIEAINSRLELAGELLAGLNEDSEG